MRRDAGFTLIEVIVAMVVAVAAFSVMAQGFTLGGRASVVAQQTTRAAVLAQRVLADIEIGEVPADRSSAGLFDDEPDFRWEVGSEPDETGLVRLTISVRWSDHGQERTYALVRLWRERTAAP
ncbi:MAG TPA: prepilin-type N-terminal cleavage/methylation domain-containing protein [Planctomycetota bacterium]|nr:prepilin-type N-terminal cleavage/methylation domain-containing protein [Planctomycetota bacterium]